MNTSPAPRTAFRPPYVLLVSLAAFTLSACAAAEPMPPREENEKPACLSPGNKAFHVDIVLDDNDEPAFDTTFQCANPTNPQSGKGDVCIGINDRPDLQFKLLGGANTGWKFVELELSGDGESWPGVLPPGAYSDFEFGSDAALLTGKPHVSINGATMHVQNNNCHEFTVHYRVVLENKETGAIFRMHPILVNRGTTY